VRKALAAILIDSESEIETEKEYSPDDSENFIQQLDITSSSESSEIEEDSCLGQGICNCDSCIKSLNVIMRTQKSINTLTREETNTLISIIDKLEDSPLKDEFLFQLNDLIWKEEKSKEEIRPVEIKKIYNRFRTPKEETSLKYLQEKIKTLKSEISELKQQNISLNYRILKLEGENI
ncbi:hypothetical protein S245_048295, partial [Arachis hypogaea]